MGHRHFPNLSNMSGFNQGHDNNHQSHQFYHPTVLAVPENGSFVSPLINLSRGGVRSDHQYNPEYRQHEYATQSFYREEHGLQPPFSGDSYYSYSDLAAGGNLSMNPNLDMNSSQMNYNYYNGQSTHDSEGAVPYPLRGGERGSYKRKCPAEPTFYGPFERGSASRSSYGAGSSSSSSQLQVEKPNFDYQGISSGPIGLPHHRGSGLPFSHEDSLRNVRSRSRLDVHPMAVRAHFSSHPSQHYHSATFQTYPPGRANLASSNADQARQEWNRIPISSVAAFTPGRGSIAGHSGVSPTADQYIVGGSTSNVTGGHHNYTSSGHPVSSSHYFNGTSAQVARGSGTVQSRSSISAYRNGLSFSSARHEAVGSAVNSYVGSSASTYTGSLLTSGVHNNYRNVRSSLALERVQPIPGLVDTQHRIGAEVSMIYSASRSSYDQYRDMRLDVDNMSYEELLALEETIGNVSTGLSEDMIIKCLSGKMYTSGDQYCVEGSCAICLEEYKSDDGIGTLKHCGHNYHVDCITKWLLVKNVCPICKAAAFTN
ncbi:probable E3 ubiquitin-protein ligase ZFP1 isoform X2 [Daucus carota subsp. sativus]|uniref:probable E3 ubiquitin-protein ligase ZFP1 isoform X2 n=1 Tax=Daucus carota subsp. sativus TaxID=79200 RepID=UPI0007F01D21|nr:PREDICTED: hornerin-like isoform X2 [Daucus carota subsp. sativus]